MAEIRQWKSWNNQGGDLVPQLVTDLPSWPRGRELIIRHGEQDCYRSGVRSTAQEEQDHIDRRPVRLVINDSLTHYDALRDDDSVLVVDPDGNCFYRALLAALKGDSENVREEEIRSLRNEVADHLAANMERYADYLVTRPEVREVADVMGRIYGSTADGEKYRPLVSAAAAMPLIADDPRSRKGFIDRFLARVAQHGFSGIDREFESFLSNVTSCLADDLSDYVNGWRATGEQDAFPELIWLVEPLFVDGRLTLEEIDDALRELPGARGKSEPAPFDDESMCQKPMQEDAQSLPLILYVYKIYREVWRREAEELVEDGPFVQPPVDPVDISRAQEKLSRLERLDGSELVCAFERNLPAHWFEDLLEDAGLSEQFSNLCRLADLSLQYVSGHGRFPYEWLKNTKLSPTVLAGMIDRLAHLQRVSDRAEIVFWTDRVEYAPISPLFDRLVHDPAISGQRASIFSRLVNVFEEALLPELGPPDVKSLIDLFLSDAYTDQVVEATLMQLAKPDRQGTLRDPAKLKSILESRSAPITDVDWAQALLSRQNPQLLDLASFHLSCAHAAARTNSHKKRARDGGDIDTAGVARSADPEQPSAKRLKSDALRKKDE